MKILSQKCLIKNESLPIELSIVKQFLRINGNDEDETLKILIQSAVNQFETYTNQALLKQRWLINIHNPCNLIKLPITPVINIIQIKFNQWSNSWQEMPLDFWTLEGNYLQINIINHYTNLEITYDAGITEKPDTIPSEIITLLLRHISYLYEARGLKGEILLDEHFHSIALNLYEKYRTMENLI